MITFSRSLMVYFDWGSSSARLSTFNIFNGDGPALLRAGHLWAMPDGAARGLDISDSYGYIFNYAMDGLRFRTSSPISFDTIKGYSYKKDVSLHIIADDKAYIVSGATSQDRNICTFDVSDLTPVNFTARVIRPLINRTPRVMMPPPPPKYILRKTMVRNVRGGPGTIFGTTTVEGQVKQRKVVLLHQRTHGLWRSQLSDEQGRFRFDNLPLDTEFTVVGEDQTREQNSIIYARVTPWVEEPTEP